MDDKDALLFVMRAALRSTYGPLVIGIGSGPGPDEAKEWLEAQEAIAKVRRGVEAKEKLPCQP